MADKDSLDKFITELAEQIMAKWEYSSIERIVSLWQHSTNQDQLGKSQEDLNSSIHQASKWFSEQTAHKLLDKYGRDSIPLIYSKNIYKYVVGILVFHGDVNRHDFKEEELLRFFILNSLSENYVPPANKISEVDKKINYWLFIAVILFIIFLI